MASSVVVSAARGNFPRWRNLPVALRRCVQFLMLALW